MLRNASLSTALLALLLLPAAVQAQHDRELVLTLGGGTHVAPPGDLYAGTITTKWSTPREPRTIETFYQERVGWQSAFSLIGRLSVDDHAWVGLRGSLGGGQSTARYSGGQVPAEEFPRELDWKGFDLMAGLTALRSGRARWGIYAGGGLQSAVLKTNGRGRDALVDLVRLDPANPLRWPDRRWKSSSGFAGTDLRVWLNDAFSLNLGGELRVVNANVSAFARTDRAAFEPAGTPITVHYDEHVQLLPSLSIGFSWKAGRRILVDPGTRALATLRGRDGDAPVSALPADAALALQQGDTLAAIAALEKAVAENPADVALNGELAILLAYSAPAEEMQWTQRARAAALLRRVLEGDPGNPRYLMALGALLEKQRMFNDSRRVLSRALDASADRPDDIALDDVAEVFYQRGHTLEAHVMNFESLKALGGRLPPVTHGDCGLISAFCLNFLQPRSFFEWFQGLPDMGQLVRTQRDDMLQEYNRALEISPGHAGANRALLAYYARLGDWERFAQLTESWVERRPEDPWAIAAHASSLVWNGAVQDAGARFREALALMRPGDRALFLDIRPILAKQEEAEWDSLDEEGRAIFRSRYFRMRDPLMLTPWNEREVEHYARVAVAELLFAEPRAGNRGALSDRGEIFIRYGRPRTVWQIQRDDQLVANFGSRTNSAGGRWIFWNYDPEHPSFIFERGLGTSAVRHVFGSMSQDYANNAKVNRPTMFRPPVRDAGTVTHQLARFRSLDGRRHDVELYALAPARRLTTAPTDTVRSGIFVFSGNDSLPIASRDTKAPIGDGRMDLRATLPEGAYGYAVEVLAADAASAATRRGTFDVEPVRPGLALSDLLLAREVRAPGEQVAHHRELGYEPLRCLAVPDDRRVHLIFEVYGLQTQQDGYARYTIELETGKNTLGGAIVRMWRGVRTESAGMLSFEREVRPIEGRAVEWFEVELPTGHADETFLRMVVTDRATGQKVSTERRLSTGCGY